MLWPGSPAQVSVPTFVSLELEFWLRCHPRGSPPREAEQGSPGIVAQAGQTSSDTQSPCLPQTKHPFSRQVSLSQHKSLQCGSKRERGEAGETGGLQPEESKELRSAAK